MTGTPRPRPRFSDDWLTAVLDSLSEGVVAIDGAGRVTAANPAAERLLDFSIDERRFTPWTGLGLDHLHDQEGRPVDPHPVERALREGEATAVTPLSPDPDLARWIELATHILDPVAGAGTGVVVTLRDITGRIAAQQDRERVLAVLRDVLAMTSHDLRGPILTIRGYAGLLAHNVEVDDPRAATAIAAIQRQVDHLSRLVVDLSLTARIETGGIVAAVEPVPVADVVDEALQTAAVEAVEVDVPPGVDVLVDPDHGRRIIENLVENAAKYGAPPIRVAATADGGTTEIVVADAGAGVPEELVPVLFDRFTRGAGTRSQGTGLGLAIVANLAALNGGSVSYARGEDGGATFVVRLPAGGGSDDEGPGPGSVAGSTSGRPRT